MLALNPLFSLYCRANLRDVLDRFLEPRRGLFINIPAKCLGGWHVERERLASRSSAGIRACETANSQFRSPWLGNGRTLCSYCCNFMAAHIQGVSYKLLSHVPIHKLNFSQCSTSSCTCTEINRNCHHFLKNLLLSSCSQLFSAFI